MNVFFFRFLLRVVFDYIQIIYNLSGKKTKKALYPQMLNCMMICLPTCIIYCHQLQKYGPIDRALNMGIHIGHFSAELSSSLPVIGAYWSDLEWYDEYLLPYGKPFEQSKNPACLGYLGDCTNSYVEIHNNQLCKSP